MILYYDATLCGFLCLLGTAIKEDLVVTDVRRLNAPATATLFEQERSIDTDHDWSEKVALGLQKKLGKRFLHILGQAFYSEAEGIEIDLLNLARRALKEGPQLLNNLAEPLVHRVDASARKMARERHRLLGLLRFSRLADGCYLARCAPHCNIVASMGSHFAGRMQGVRWIILDEKRHIGVFAENANWQVCEQVELTASLVEHASEQQITDLWRDFYASISNRDRYNPRLRQQFMPKFYWPYLTEMRPGPG